MQVKYKFDQQKRVVKVKIPDRLRKGKVYKGKSGSKKDIEPCLHCFKRDPIPKPDHPKYDFTGRYETSVYNYAQIKKDLSLSPPHCHCNVQINQAGIYIYGWFQVDFVRWKIEEDGEKRTLGFDNAIRGNLRGEVKERQYVDLRVSVNGVVEKFKGSLEMNENEMFAIVFRKTKDIIISRTDFTYKFRWALLRRVTKTASHPESQLSQLKENNILRLAEENPLRGDHYKSLKEYIKELKIKLAINNDKEMRKAAALTFINVVNKEILNKNRVLFPGSKKKYAFFRPEQAPLVRHLYLILLNTIRIEDRTILDELYLLFMLPHEKAIKEEDDEKEEKKKKVYPEFGPFREFRKKFGSNTRGDDILPRLPSKYKYEVSGIFLKVGAPIPGAGHKGKFGQFGLTGAGQLMKLTMTKYIERVVDKNKEWEKVPTSGEFYTILGLVTLGAETKALTAEWKDFLWKKYTRWEEGKIGAELGAIEFEVESFFNWGWDDFHGMWNLFAWKLELKTPLGFPFDLIPMPKSKSESYAGFYGNGNLPPLIGKFESKAIAITDDDSVKGALSFTFALGYLYRYGDLHRDSSGASDGIIFEPMEETINWDHSIPEFFHINKEDISQKVGRKELGYLLAENLLVFQSPTNHLRIAGHTSRTASWRHNKILSIRRAQFTLQTIIDILGNKFMLPLSDSFYNTGQGSVLLFGFGEMKEKEDLKVRDGKESAKARKVEITINGSTLATL
jgi:hypothetical protein